MKRLRWQAILAVVLLGGCAAGPKPATLTEGARTFTSPANRTYSIRSEEVHDEDEALPPMSFAGDPDEYRGSARKAAKLAFSSADLQAFESLRTLRSSLPKQSTMAALGISSAPESGRHSKEDRNVRVTGLLVAASKEDANDYHLILCHRPAQLGQWCFTAEISGLPTDDEPFFAELEAARSQFLEFFGDEKPGTKYDIYDPPIPVRIAGSLFFAVNHGSGVVGPTGYKTKTSWEIHPVSEIVFEP